MKTKAFLVLASLALTYGYVGATPFGKYHHLLTSEKYSKFSTVTIIDSTNVSVQPTGEGTFSIVKALKVQNLKGVMENRVIKYDYDPLTADARFEYVRVYHEDGTYTEVDVNKTCDYAAPARAIYWGARQIMLQIDNLKPGDIISYKVDKKGFTYALLGASDEDESRFIPPMRGQFYDIVPFWVSEPTIRKVYKVEVPMEKELQFQFYQGECSSSMRYEGGKKAYTFSMNEVMPFEKEPNMVDLFDAAPKLMMSTTSDWKEKSRWFSKVNEDYGSFDAIPEAQKKVDELIKGKKTEMEKIAVLTHLNAFNSSPERAI